jgi:CPA2 family monovalent cation:H+ antiporter-2
MEFAFLQDLVYVFAAAVAVATLSRFVRLPSVGGFLLTGVLIGPSALSLVRDQHLVEVLAEVGVMALLFTIGLEFSPARLRRLGRPFLIGGGLQSLATIAVGALLATALGFDMSDAVFLGFLLALSSTAIVLKLYGDRREIDAPHGRAAVGILLFQDVLLVPMIIVTPVLAGNAGGSLGSFVARFVIGVGVVASIFVVGRFALPRLMREIARTRMREALLLGAIAVCLGMALVTASFGFSLALGAFLAGILLSESEFSPQVIADILPFRAVFNSLFFISVGMLLSVGFLRDNLLLVLAVSLGVVLVKAIIAFVAVRLVSYPNRTALLAGAGLAQVGEFSFVLITVGLANGLLSATVYQVFLAAAVLTMLATPLLIAGAPRLAERLPAPVLAGCEPEAIKDRPRAGHVIIVGFGVNGRNLALVLRHAGIPYLVIELNGETVRKATAEGEPILFGDASSLAILHLAAVEGASLAVFAISDPAALRRSVRLAHTLNPKLHIVVRTRHVDEIDEAVRHGAAEVVAEEFEASIEILARVLGYYDVPLNVIEAETKVLRGDGYRVLRAADATVPPLSNELIEALAGGTTAVYAVTSACAAVGKTILETDLRHRTGASIIAVVRGVESFPNPKPDFRLAVGDRVVLVGSHTEIRDAMDVLG